MAEPLPPDPRLPRGLPAWDPKESRQTELLPDDLHRLYVGGKVNLVKDATYPMTTGMGDVRDVPAADVNEHLHHGYTFAGQREVRTAEIRNDPLAGLKAFGDGVANQAMLGFGDAIRVSQGADPLAIQIRREEHHASRTLGEIGGGIGGAAAMGVLAPEALAEVGAARVFGQGALATAGAALTGGAVGGAIRGVGEAVDEAALGNTELTAESVLIHGGMGALIGGATGGILGGIRGLRMRAADAEALQAAATGEAAPEGYGAMRVGVLQRLQRALAGKGGADDEFLAKAYHPDPAVREELYAAHLERPALRDAAHAALLPALREAHGLAPEGSPAAAAISDAFGERIEGPSVRQFVESIDRPSGDGRMQAMRQLVGELRRGAQGLDVTAETPGILHGRTRTLEVPGMERVVAMRAAADGLEGALDQAGGRLASANILAKQLAREGGAAAGGIGGLVMGGVEAALGHVGLGAATEAANVAYGAVARPAHQFVRLMQIQRALTAVKGSLSDSMEEIASGSVGRATKAVADRTRLSPATVALLESRDAPTRQRAYEERRAELESVANPAVLAERASAATAHLQDAAPEAAAMMTLKLGTIANLTLAAAPTPLVAANPLRGPLKAPTISDSDLRSFTEVDAALQDPNRIIRSMVLGRVPHPKAVAAVRQAYPAWFNEAQSALAAAVSQHPEGIPQAQRTAISVTFGIDGHASLKSSSLTLQQAANAPIAPPPSPGRGRGSRGGSPHLYSPKDAVAELNRAAPGKLDRLLVK